jgi:peroxiredoxin
MRLAFVVSALAGFALTAGISADPTPSKQNLGKKIGNVSFKDAAGKTVSLHDFKSKKAIVIVFLSFDCPVSNSYSQPLTDMADELGKHGVAFLGLTVNADETDAEVAKHAKEYKLSFPVYCDRKLAAADALKAEVTPECFVLDGDFVLRYRGRIDNSYYERLKKQPQVTEHNLKQVIGEILSGRPVKTPATVAIGCPIQRDIKPAAQDGEVTYYKDVLPILQKNCQSCHRPGEVGPFSLLTYRQAVNWAEDIKSYTQRRIMPPWKPSEGFEFHNERRLTEKEIATLAAWVDNGTPAGNEKDAPPARKFPEGWQLGTPDLILSVSEEFTLGASGKDVFRCFVLPTNLTEDKYVAAVEVRPGNPRIVHHTIQFIDLRGNGRKLEQVQQERDKKLAKDPYHPVNKVDKGPGYNMTMGVGFLPQGALLGWAPGQMPRYLPDGSGMFLPKNSDIVMQVHYHRNGRVEKDKTQVGIYFAKKPVVRPFGGSVVAGGDPGILGKILFTIPAGAERHHLQGDAWATGEYTLHTVMPHMHLIGKEIKCTITPPEGKERTLVHIKEWDYNWQETYSLKEPLTIKPGTKFHVDAWYDNSAKNPNNPSNPPKDVKRGEETTNEMCFVFLGGVGASRVLPMSPFAPVAKKTAAK